MTLSKVRLRADMGAKLQRIFEPKKNLKKYQI
uniref:Ras-related protein Rab7 n=1 Tax=Rhizophora mucronata TaxID=61149 RepID=A0A2P2NCU8_RHIMU